MDVESLSMRPSADYWQREDLVTLKYWTTRDGMNCGASSCCGTMLERSLYGTVPEGVLLRVCVMMALRGLKLEPKGKLPASRLGPDLGDAKSGRPPASKEADFCQLKPARFRILTSGTPASGGNISDP
jgi:hypothetical protein